VSIHIVQLVGVSVHPRLVIPRAFLRDVRQFFDDIRIAMYNKRVATHGWHNGVNRRRQCPRTIVYFISSIRS
jgi:hypothetical protein